MKSLISHKHYTFSPGKRINKVDVDLLFKKYQEIGFLYPAKKKILDPYFLSITNHWKRLAITKERLLWILTKSSGDRKKHFSSVSFWRNSNYGLFAQHLVSSGNPLLSLQVMLKAQYLAEHHFTKEEVKSSQNWFRPNNRYAFRVFASMLEKLGPQKAALTRFQYLHLPLDKINIYCNRRYRAEVVDNIDPNLIDFVKDQYGSVFTEAEELTYNDISLKKLGGIYRKYGFELKRQVFKICHGQTGQIVACVIANRAPLGMNFSYLENRAYYILDSNLDPITREQVLCCINSKIESIYADFALKIIPIVTDENTSEALQAGGAQWLREYMQSIWMRDGFKQYHEHLQSFLERIERRYQKESVLNP